jgi:large subunit ribosomal protein L6
MSRIGNAPITLPSGTTVTINGSEVVAKGSKGELNLSVPHGIEVIVDGTTVSVVRKSNDKARRALHGYVRATVANMVTGVTEGWKRTLEMAGVGYRANLSGTDLVLSVGFSHQVTITPPAGITFAVADGKIVVTGIDKQVVGQTAAQIREVKKPEPYKGKGIKYEGERIRKKAGKAKAVGGAPGAK